MITLSVLLFAKPAKELDRENQSITHDDIADLGITIGARLSRIAAAVKHLEAEGWEPVLRGDGDVDALGLGLGRIPGGE